MKSITSIANRRFTLRWAGIATALLCGAVALNAQAATVLLADSTMVTGSESASFSFYAPGPGTVSAQISNLDWPVALSSLSFVASTPNQVLASWSDPASQPTQGPALVSFQVGGQGTYYADIMATAGGPLDLGVYSFALNFTPEGSTVPLPAAGWLLLTGILGFIALRRTLQRRPTAEHLPLH
jgi:hypothetical protein